MNFSIRKSACTVFFIFSIIHVVHAQLPDSSSLNFSGYTEGYYSYDFGNPVNHERAGFLYNHKRHNEFNINFMYAKVVYASKKSRASTAIMFGNYPEYNLAAEPALLKNIFEANVGVKLSKKNNIWLDAGVMPSHIGFESAVSADCWTLSRSLAAENSPYFETGAKVSFINKAENLTVALLVLNGWQRIRRPDYINKLSAGLFLQYKISSQLSITYSNFVGSDKPDSVNANRIFHDTYFIFDGKKIGFIAGFDIGQEQRADGKYNVWYTPQLVSRIRLSNKLKMALRGEYYNDKDQVIIATATPNGFETIGTSLGLDYAISENALFRIEMKYYNSKDRIFYDNKSIGYENYCATTSLSIKF